MNEETEKALQRIKQALARDRMARVVSFPIGRVESKNRGEQANAEILSFREHQAKAADKLDANDN